MTKFLIRLITLSLLLAALAACGGSTEPAPDSGASDPDPVVAATEAPEAQPTAVEATDDEEAVSDDAAMEEAAGEQIVLNAYVNGANDVEHSEWVKAEFEALHPLSLIHI